MVIEVGTEVESILENLNENQRLAVQCPETPALVLAGAGSGKTRVLISRVAYLLSFYNITPDKILAVTFTNKAANEMKTRLRSLITKDFQHLWVGTFHSIFAKILRIESAYVGYHRNFVIYE